MFKAKNNILLFVCITLLSFLGSAFSEDIGNLFLNTYDRVSKLQHSSNTQSLISVREQLLGVTNNGCLLGKEPTEDDINTILMSYQSYRRYLSTIYETSRSSTIPSKTTLKESCQKVIACLSDNNKNIVIDTRREIESCQSIVYNAYLTSNQLSTSYLSQPLANQNDNIYINGIETDAPFDLFIDIKNIKDILFTDKGPALPRMVYYSMPSVAIPSLDDDSAFVPGALAGLGNSNGALGGSTTGNNLSTGNLNPNTNGNNTGNNNSNNNTTTTNNTNNSNPNTTAVATTTNQGQQLIQNSNLCLPPLVPPTIPGTTTNNNNPSANIIDEYIQTQAELLDLLDPLLNIPDSPSNNPGTGDDPANTSNTGNNQPILAINDNPNPQSTKCDNSCTLENGELGQIKKRNCEAKCCINACNTLPITIGMTVSEQIRNKTACLSQCLCGEFKTPNDELRLKFCRVPAQISSSIPSNEKITTIQQGIKAINKIFTYLSNNGLMTKRSKTKEFLDSSFSDIKMQNILNITIFVAIKPIFDKITQSTQKKEQQTKDLSLRQAIHPSGTIFGSPADRGRYVVIGSHPETLARNSIRTSYNQFNDNVRDLSAIYCAQQGKVWKNNKGSDSYSCQTIDTSRSIITSATEENTMTINDDIYKFIINNNIFRNQVGQSVNDMLQTSKSMKERANNAK